MAGKVTDVSRVGGKAKTVELKDTKTLRRTESYVITSDPFHITHHHVIYSKYKNID